MKKSIKFSIEILMLVALIFLALFVNKVFVAHAQSQPITYIKTAEQLKNAIVSRQETIFVDDITFPTPETIVFNDSVRIIGKSEKSTIKNLHVQVHGSQLVENKIKVSLENVVFDGCFDKTKYDLTAEKPFDQVFGLENDNGFLFTDDSIVGYYDIDINNCEFTNYSGWCGAVIYLPWNDAVNGEKIINIKDSKFYGNVGAERIVDIFDNKVKLTVKNVEMYDNYVISKVANLTNIFLNVDGLNIHDNNFIPLDSREYSTQDNDMNMIRGGGIYLGGANGIVKNMTIENNQTYYGGGAFIVVGFEGDKRLVLADCLFKNNRAKIYGGGVGIESHVGYPVYFTNCKFVGNSAPKGGSVCAMPYFWDRTDGNTSLIEFSFCDFSENVADDDKAFSYYYDGFTKTKKDGKIVVKGCRIQDPTFLVGNGEKENDYNIVSLTAVTENQSAKVPCEEYGLWANGYYNGKTQARNVGFIPQTEAQKISPLQPILYGICTAGSIVIALLYLFKSTEKHIEMVLIAVAVSVINVGYTLLSVSTNITTALLFNNLAYLGNAFLPLFFMIAVANVCRYKVKKVSKIILSVITVVNFLFTTTVWFSGLFYVEPTYGVVNGAVDIMKENGILHTIYVLYVFAYFCVIFGIMSYSLVKNRLEHKKYGILIFSAEFVCLLVWTVEMFVPFSYELLSVAFMLTSLLLTVLFFEMEKYGILTISEIIASPKIESEVEDNGSIQIIDANGIETICNKLVERNVLSRRETEILALLLQGKSATTISEILFISKNTIKSHTANIYKKLSVKTREELRYRVISEIQN